MQQGPELRVVMPVRLLLLLPLVLAVAGCGSTVDTDDADGPHLMKDETGRPMSIHAVLAGDPRFETFASLVDESLFNNELTYDDYFVVFAPTEDAFRLISRGDVAAMRRPEARSKLKAFVATHIIEGWANFETDEWVGPPRPLKPGETLPDGPLPIPRTMETKYGHEIEIRVGRDSVQVGGESSCPTRGILCGNGWIYPLTRPMQPPREVNVLSRLATDGRFQQLLAGIVKAGLLTHLHREGLTEWTLLAPTDDAINRLPEGQWREWMADRDAMLAVIKRHVVPGRVERSRISELTGITTIDGQLRETTDTARSLRVSGVELDSTSLPASDGIIHPVDGVLPEVADDDN